MRNFLFISIIAFSLLLFGQIEQKETLAKYIIRDGEINNKDITYILTTSFKQKAGQCLVENQTDSISKNIF